MQLALGALLAVMTTGSTHGAGADLAVSLAAAPVAGSCAIVSTATIVSFDTTATREITYRFVRSDGTVSPIGRLALAGDGAVAQSVRDAWTPRGAAPWVALEIVAPRRIRSGRLVLTQPSRCAHVVAAS